MYSQPVGVEWRQPRSHLRQHWRQLRLFGLAWPQYTGREEEEEEGGDPDYYVNLRDDQLPVTNTRPLSAEDIFIRFCHSENIPPSFLSEDFMSWQAVWFSVDIFKYSNIDYKNTCVSSIFRKILKL